MPLDTEVGLGPGDIVLDGNPAAPLERGTAAPTYRSMSIVAKRLDGSGYHLVLRPLARRHWLDGDPAPPRKGAQHPRISQPMSIVAKRSPISATAELLLQAGCTSWHPTNGTKALKET